MSIPPAARRKSAKQLSVDEIHDNTSQEIISITTDKLKLALLEHLGRLAQKNAWHMPLSLLVGVILVFCSANFKEAFGMSPATWQAIFFLFGSGCLIWFFNTVRVALLSKESSMEVLIAAIKNKS